MDFKQKDRGEVGPPRSSLMKLSFMPILHAAKKSCRLERALNIMPMTLMGAMLYGDDEICMAEKEGKNGL